MLFSKIIPSFFVDKANCTRQFESQLSLRSFALSFRVKDCLSALLHLIGFLNIVTWKHRLKVLIPIFHAGKDVFNLILAPSAINNCQANWLLAFAVAFILNEKEELLVVRRKNEPAKGTLDLPGGFVDMDETGEEGVAREVKEETGLEVIGVNYQFSIPNLYLYSDFLVHTLDMFYVVKVKDLSHVEAMDDAEESYWIPLSNLHPEEFGLGSIRQGVAKFLAKHKTKE